MDKSDTNWEQVPLREVAIIHKEKINPSDLSEVLVDHYSIPAFDQGGMPQRELASHIRSTKSSVPFDSVLISKLNPRFPRVWMPKVAGEVPSLASTEFVVLRPRACIDRKFLKYICLLPAFRGTMESIVTGTSASHQRVRPDDLLGITVSIPSATEQRAIAHILGTLDDKIELNQQMNHTLEAMARAIFKSWFVDFDPVRAKMDGRQPYGMDAETAALFPDSFDNSLLGKIPKGWKVKTLSDLCKITIGGDWGQDRPFEGAVEVACLRGVDFEHLRANGWANAPRRWIKKASLEKREMKDSDVLIAASGVGPAGRPLWVSPQLKNVFPVSITYSNFCKRFQTPSPEHALYVDRLLFNMRETGEIWNYIEGTSIPNLDARGLLTAHYIVIPPDEVLSRFFEIVSPFYSKLYSKESNTLGTLRDTLLPKLLSGEIRVKDAEKVVEEAV